MFAWPAALSRHNGDLNVLSVLVCRTSAAKPNLILFVVLFQTRPAKGVQSRTSKGACNIEPLSGEERFERALWRWFFGKFSRISQKEHRSFGVLRCANNITSGINGRSFSSLFYGRVIKLEKSDKQVGLIAKSGLWPFDSSGSRI